MLKTGLFPLNYLLLEYRYLNTVTLIRVTYFNY